MNVTRLRLENFKRFSDLTIDLSPFAGAPKLVLLIGANGSGKSSVFDAFEYLSAQHKGDAAPPSTRFSEDFSDGFYKGEAYDKFLSYLKKDPASDMAVSCSFGGGFEVGRTNGSSPTTSPTEWDVKSAFYGRSSFRTAPELRATPQTVDIGADADRPRRVIDFDSR
ncbi:MAG: AAA family ATPase, partial [Acidobacteria bacterium]|nr:AAA family ATPase [Acidobacteriota bacterium]